MSHQGPDIAMTTQALSITTPISMCGKGNPFAMFNLRILILNMYLTVKAATLFAIVRLSWLTAKSVSFYSPFLRWNYKFWSWASSLQREKPFQPIVEISHFIGFMKSRFRKIICQALKAGFAALCFSSPLQTYMGEDPLEKKNYKELTWFDTNVSLRKSPKDLLWEAFDRTRLLLGDRHTVCFCKWSGIMFVLILNECLWFRAAFWIYAYNMNPLQYASKIHFEIPWYDELCGLVIFHLACFIAVNFTQENRFSETCDHSSCQVV